MNRITVTAAALLSAAAMLADHSEEAPDGAIMSDVERLGDMLAAEAVAVGGSVPTELRLTVEPEPAPPIPFADRSPQEQETALQEAARRLVGQEIHGCASVLISGLQKVAYDLTRDQCEALALDPDELTQLAYRDADADDYRDALDTDDEKRLRVERVECEHDGEVFRWQIVDPDDGEVFDEGSEDEELDAWRALFDADSRDQPDGSEIFEHWIVSNWLRERLAARGERTADDVAGFTIWGRPTTGQSIAMDSVIRDIAAAYFLNRAEG